MTTICDLTEELAVLHRELFPPKPKPAVNGSNGKVNSFTQTSSGSGLSDSGILDRAGRAANGDKFKRLWDGDWSDYSSQSEADLALCCMLAFWVGNDPSRIDALFRQSGLCREKWLEREDYRNCTISKSIENTGDTYNPNHNRPGAESSYVVSVVSVVPPAAEEGGGAADEKAESASETTKPAGAKWPQGLKDEAFHGPAGELVRAIEPHSEADPVAILIQFLAAFGNLIARCAHFIVEADRHFMNLFIVLVGQTAKGRKGTSLGQVLRVLSTIDSLWKKTRIMNGLASGEALIGAVRDEIRERVPIRQNGRVVDYEEVVSDQGEKDKRLLIVEPEFARILQVSERETNTLSAILRQAWDDGNLQNRTKKQAALATEAHVSCVGHVTKDELKRRLTDTAMGNGFANRFLYVCTRRSKRLPEGGALGTVDFGPIMRRIQTAVDFARGVGEMRRDEQARNLWREVYAELSEGKPGLLGSVTSRAEAQVLRIACIYALLDCSVVVRAEHLLAALAVWQYCEDSARFIFGDALGDATGDEILRALRNRPEGMTRTEIRDYFSKNKRAADVDRALSMLQEYGRARVIQEGTGGRPAERWFAV